MARMAPRTAVLHGQELSFVDSGTGPTVLVVHGILGSQQQWSRLVDLMDDDHRVVAPDLFGHGESAKPMGDYSLSAHAATLRDLLDHLDVERVSLVGHSLGGGIAMQFFYLFPERVERLVLVSSGGLGREVNLALRAATLPGAAQVLGVVASTPVLSGVEALGNAAARAGWRPGADVTAIWRGFRSLSQRESRQAFLATTRAVIDVGGQTISAHGHIEGELPVPALIVWGSKDHMIPASHATDALEVAPEVRVEIFEGAGHFPHLEEPDRFATLLREFVAAD